MAKRLAYVTLLALVVGQSTAQTSIADDLQGVLSGMPDHQQCCIQHNHPFPFKPGVLLQAFPPLPALHCSSWAKSSLASTSRPCR